ncbi:MAG TPA: 2-amino-4-oxopentanoate thiolase subunit OrtA [Selenomonadales bacterium]|nr:2-amino-4-oxopentanoate thiolase subunit OrtA [Selenomonadales bacterium]
MPNAKQGDWVQVYSVILPVGERAPQVPAETRQVPLEMRVRGFLVEEKADLGETVRIRTAVGRVLAGKLVAVNPDYGIDYGQPVPELLTIGQELRQILGGKVDA